MTRRIKLFKANKILVMAQNRVCRSAASCAHLAKMREPRELVAGLLLSHIHQLVAESELRTWQQVAKENSKRQSIGCEVSICMLQSDVLNLSF